MNRHILHAFLFLGLAPLLGGCIKSNLDHCDIKTQLQIKAYAPDGTDITSTAEAGEVLLFEYDGQGVFLSRRVVPAQEVASGKTLPVSLGSGSARYYMAWSNLTDTARMLRFFPAEALEKSRIIPLKDGEGYFDIGRPIFFGRKTLTSDEAKANPVVEVLIMHAVSQIHVSVVGMATGENPADYRIEIANDDQTELDFNNNVVRAGNAKYRKTAGWLESGKMMGTVAPFVTLPSPAGASKTVLLYKGTELIATASQDSDGKLIAPPAGKRVNVLINLKDLTSGIKCIVSDWNQVVEWKEW